MPKTADFPKFSAVAVHQQGLQHSCRGADADSLGLDCTAAHRDSTGAHVRCPRCAVRAGFSACGGDSRDPTVPSR